MQPLYHSLAKRDAFFLDQGCQIIIPSRAILIQKRYLSDTLFYQTDEKTVLYDRLTLSKSSRAVLIKSVGRMPSEKCLFETSVL